MKKLSFIFALFFSILSFSQTQDLFSLAKGNLIGFNSLFDDKDNLYGYVSIYSYGKSSDKTKKFEYVILDKNLNPVANKEFEGDITAGEYFGYINFNKKLILTPTSADYSLIKTRDYFVPRSVEVDLASNTPKTKIYYDYQRGTFNEIAQPKNLKEERKEDKLEKKEKGFNYRSGVYEIKEGGFLAIEYNDYGNYENNNNLIKYNANKEEMWRYQYNTSGDKKINESINVIEKDEKHIYAILQKKNKSDNVFYFLVLDMQTGKEISNKIIDSISPETAGNITHYYSYGSNVDNSKTFDDKIVLVGRNYSFNRFNGFVRLVIDKKSFNIDTQFLTYADDFKTFLPKLIYNDTFSDGYQLRTKDFFFLKDGSTGILMEKYKPESQYTAPKTKDLYYAYTDKNFKLKEVKVFEKEKSKWINDDYLFSQYLNEGKDVVFFYRDLQKDDNTKEKNWKLFINTLIDGNFKQEEVQISEKDSYTILPYVGKEGYILLREINEKEKFNKIRLERLNY